MQVVPEPGARGDGVPFSIEPVLGWRVWRLALNEDGRPELRSTTRPDVWPAGEPMRARCVRHRDATVPDRSCMCGLYATSSPEDLGRAGVINQATVVVGAVAMWGTVVEHARGARARFAYPARLALVCGKCLADGRGAVEARYVIDVSEGLFALCSEHLRVTDGARSAADVQAELLSTYGVEVLPLERVARALRTPLGIGSGPVSGRALAERAIGFVFAAIGFVFSLVMSLFFAAAFLGIVASLIGGVLGLFDRTVDPRVRPAAQAPPFDPSQLSQIEEPVPGGEADLAALRRDGWPHPGAGALPAVPPFGFLCGRSDGPVVHIVDCAGPADLWGFAAGEPPSGPDHDCAPGWLAYTREPDRWICWHAVPGETPNVRAWTSADGEWFDEDGG